MVYLLGIRAARECAPAEAWFAKIGSEKLRALTGRAKCAWKAKAGD
jgi:hypothetical protein